MKAILLIALLVIASSASSVDSFSSMWEAWKVQHKKVYRAAEEATRFGIFVENFHKINRLNAESTDVKFAINKFADLTAYEFKTQQASCGFVENNKKFVEERTAPVRVVGDLPDSVDWRNKGAVTPVKDQGQCGSCWTFSTTGVLEGFYFINNGKLLSFSEQQIVDCDTDQDEGCNGGWPYLAVEYAAKNGLELESDYPYTAQDGNCKYNKNKATQVAGGYAFVTANSTDSLKAALVNGPVSVAIEADQDVFQFYSKGVISTGCGAQLDHAVLAVGYQKVGVLEAFIVKNSWGDSWGQDGYVFISTSLTRTKVPAVFLLNQLSPLANKFIRIISN
jgi:KDEL-tailed cysteine endopeptidase